MIREFIINDLNNIMELWLSTNILAHDFIDKKYWESNFDSVKEMMPQATIYIYEEHAKLKGFIGLMDIFVYC